MRGVRGMRVVRGSYRRSRDDTGDPDITKSSNTSPIELHRFRGDPGNPNTRVNSKASLVVLKKFRGDPGDPVTTMIHRIQGDPGDPSVDPWIERSI